VAKKRKKGRELRIDEVAPAILPLEVPVRKWRFDVGPERRAFVFAIEHADRLKLSHLKLEQMAQVLGNLVHPHFSALLVVQPGAKLSVYEVVDPCNPPKHVAAAEG